MALLISVNTSFQTLRVMPPSAVHSIVTVADSQALFSPQSELAGGIPYKFLYRPEGCQEQRQLVPLPKSEGDNLLGNEHDKNIACIRDKVHISFHSSRLPGKWY